MKKITAFVLVICVCLGLCACGADNSASQKPTETKSTTQATKPTTAATQPTTATGTTPTTNSHTHSFGEWTTIQAATCAKKGTEQRTCTCGETETQEIPATNTHSTRWGKCANCSNISTELASVAAEIETEFNSGFKKMQECTDYVDKALSSKYYTGTSSAILRVSGASAYFKKAAEKCGDMPEFAEIKEALLAMANQLSGTFSGTISVYGDSRDLQTLKTIINSLGATETNLKKVATIIDDWHTYQ